jgi:hypothetical protein
MINNVINMKNIPKCCGIDMCKSVETMSFVEFKCDKCGSIVYIKKEDVEVEPTLLDD